MAQMIKVLSDIEAKKIAAGEVVERPVNIVKELVENSLDAGAKSINVYIEQSGKKSIRVVDDGCGMSKEDARLCFSSHATSKIQRLKDLESIKTFGFRGEGLASISSVSKVLLKTNDQENEDSLGIFLKYVDGVFCSEEECICSRGTDIVVEDLFYNIPARKKFLKRDETEWNQILFYLQAVALSNLNVFFKCFRDGKSVLNLPIVKNVKERVIQLWGLQVADNIIPLEERILKKEDQDFSIKGDISSQQFWRYERTKIFFFVNGRWIKNTDLTKYLMKGYQNVLPPGRFPVAVIFITIKPDLVDINVHPKKEEVRFEKPVQICTYLQRFARETLENSVNRLLRDSTQNNTSAKQQNYFAQQESTGAYPELIEEPINETLKRVPLHENRIEEYKQPQIVEEFERIQKQADNICDENFWSNQQDYMKQKEVVTKDYVKILGQLFKTYILIEKQDSFIIIDQHAAHERILYEQFKESFEKKESIQLLFPEVLKLDCDELQLLLQEKDFFEHQGIFFSVVENDKIKITGSPPGLRDCSLSELLKETVVFIKENSHFDREVFRKKLNEHIHSHLACKSAVKAGDSLTEEQIKKLVDDLLKTFNRYICVHGRPTMWSFEKKEIEKKFRRR
jgi:DNA mismatch repair protein MutL